MREDIPDNLPVFDETDDAHCALTFWTDQRVNLPGLRRDRLLFSESAEPNFFLMFYNSPPVRECKVWHRLFQFLFVSPVRHYCNIRST
jgi:hypothetical protein